MSQIEPTEGSQAGTVLVVDDASSHRELLRDVLEPSGFTVIEAEDGDDALVELEALCPDVILLDVIMPRMDGVEVCRRIKANPRTAPVPVILVTSLGERDDRIKGIEAGATDFLTKPIDRQEIILKIQNAVSSKRRYDRVQATCERLLKLQRLQDDLTHMIVHDLRSPLSGVMVSLHLLEMGLDESDEEPLEDLAHALHSSRAMSRMIDSLLDVTKMESGELVPRKAEVDLVDIVEDAIRGLGGLVDQATVRVEQPDAPVVLSVDRALITRVVENLLGNALKFAPPDGVVTIRIRSTPDGGRIEVSDTGPGVPEEYREKIFEKFEQLEARENHARASTGLGLAFCKLAVEAHGGTLGVESELGENSTFWVELSSPKC